MGFFDKLKEQLNFKEAYDNIKAEQKAISNGTAGKFEYLGGHPSLVAGEITVWKDEKNALILQQNTGNPYKYKIQVIHVEWDEQGQRSLGKAAAGAIVGGVLTGGIGLIAGAAIGGRKKDNSIAIVRYKDGDFEREIYFRADASKYQELIRLL
ncbi:hypothetical protein QYF48_12130 [Brevibacillus agri]|uniref:hypothetical protein n=1 Tax=Brevibacillus agri TaxID=51101 RepID=UPI0025B717F6|nr:hypothetical protein [Brevibacillus agri]MDN4093563.1 hypothetical protein [Brevibacillus agri]